jgi:hypothetical protein
MGRENDENYVLGYMCGVDWECELGMAAGGNRIYGSEEDLRESTNCWKGCGIVEVKIHFSRVVFKGDGT